MHRLLSQNGASMEHVKQKGEHEVKMKTCLLVCCGYAKFLGGENSIEEEQRDAQ